MGIRVINNIEIGDIPPTPDFNLFDARVMVPLAYQSIINESKKLGFPIAYAQEQDGLVVQNLIPIKKTESSQISSSSKSNLELHTETAFHPFKPDYVILLCLRGDESASTNYSLAEDFIEGIDEESLDILQKPLFVTEVDDSFKSDGEETIEIIVSPLRIKDNSWSVTYDKYAMRGVNNEAQKALDTMTAAIEGAMQSIVLKKGQILEIDNSNVVHGRSIFSPRYDGTDRWLLRTMVVKSLPPKTHMDGPVITTSFRKKASAYA
jgi:hypothetical protein